VSEKMSAALEVQHAVAVSNAGLIPARTIAIYHRKIRANQRRLSAAKPPATGLARGAIKGAPT
jgi:hypothetical protein